MTLLHVRQRRSDSSLTLARQVSLSDLSSASHAGATRVARFSDSEKHVRDTDHREHERARRENLLTFCGFFTESLEDAKWKSRASLKTKQATSDGCWDACLPCEQPFIPGSRASVGGRYARARLVQLLIFLRSHITRTSITSRQNVKLTLGITCEEREVGRLLNEMNKQGERGKTCQSHGKRSFYESRQRVASRRDRS